MNIFAYDPCPYKSALWLDDVRKNKMIVETAQLLSTAMNVLDPTHNHHVYKTSYLNHPCAVWARQSAANFTWLVAYMEHLVAQRGKPHKSSELLPAFKSFRTSGMFPEAGLTPFANCARNQSLGIDYSFVDNVHAAYRLYSRERWSNDTIKLTWNNGKRPFWFGE